MDTSINAMLDAAIGPFPRRAVEVIDFWVTLMAFVTLLRADSTDDVVAQRTRHGDHLFSLKLQSIPKMTLVNFVLDCSETEMNQLLSALQARISPPEQASTPSRGPQATLANSTAA